MTIGDAIRLAEPGRPPDGVVRCLIYVRISMDKAHDGHGVANQLAKLEKRANERGWTVVYRLSDNDIGVTRKDPTKPGKYRPGAERNLPAVTVRGSPTAGEMPNDGIVGDAGSRIANTPASSCWRALALASSSAEAPGGAGLFSARWA